ncbi:MAG: tetratricopeptide repeat protein [Anaerolineae bacterium]|nr:tetratricopeptide repeat protein [Anaerolineae bacterium]
MNDPQSPPLPDFDALWDYDHPAATEEQFRALLPAAEASGDLAYPLELQTQIARTLSLQRRFDEAHALLDQVKRKLAGAPTRPQIRYWLERGRAYNSAGQRDQARLCFASAWEQAQAAREDFHAVDAAHMLAIVESGQAALDWNLKALALAENSPQERARTWCGSLYNNIGWTYHDQGDYPAALEIFRKALDLRRADGKPGPIQIARWCIARTLRSLGRVDEALAIQQALLSEHDPNADPPGYTYEELGECLLLLGREAEARPYFARAYTVLSQDAWLVANEPARLERLRTLGQ